MCVGVLGGMCVGVDMYECKFMCVYVCMCAYMQDWWMESGIFDSLKGHQRDNPL